MTRRTALGIVWPCVGLLTMLGDAAPARANCDLPSSYQYHVDLGSVFVFPESRLLEGCSSRSMLRENVNTGEVVQLADFCAPCEGPPTINHPDGMCYLDECVPPGTYRYGFEEPYECYEYACFTELYVEVSVEASEPGCIHSAGNAPPTYYSSEGHFPDDRHDPTCIYGGGADAGPGADASPGPVSDGGGGCATSSTTPTTVLTMQLLALLLGLLLLLRRRRG